MNRLVSLRTELRLCPCLGRALAGTPAARHDKTSAFALLLAQTLLGSHLAWGQISVADTSPVTENFDSMAALTALPANWRMGEETVSPTWSGGNANVIRQASTGSPTTGATYNWGQNGTTERAAGAMTSGTFASPNSLMACYRNDNASPIAALTISYTLERYRMNSASASVQFFYSTDGSTWVEVAAGDVAAAALPAGASTYYFAAPTPIINVAAFNVTDLNVAHGGLIYLRWNLDTTGSNSQGLGIDDVSVTATFAIPALALADSGTQVTAAEVAPGAVNHVLHKFQLSVTAADATLTRVDFSSAGTCAAADLDTFKLRYSTDAALDSGDVTNSTLSSSLGAGSHSFSSLSQTIARGATGYFFITADVAGAATAGRTLSVDAIGTGDLTFSEGTKSGSTTAGGAQTIAAAGTLAAGDIAIVGYRSHATDGFAFVTWKNIAAGTVLGFWDHSCSSNGTFQLTENRMTWTAPAGGIVAGTVVTISCAAGNATANAGTAAGTLDGISGSGDQIFAGVGGTFPPDGGGGTCTYDGTLLYGMNTEANWLTSGTPTSETSYQPAALGGPYQSLAFGTTGDNGQYTGDRALQATWAEYKALIHNTDNWTRENAGTTVLDATAFALAADPPGATITNPASAALWVGQSTSGYTIRGAVNSNAAGLLRWTNSLTGAAGTTPATNGWFVSLLLSTGANVITVTATNLAGTSVSDSIMIRRMTASTGGTVVISEFMQNPNAVSDEAGEWVELFNRTSADIDIRGWTIRDLDLNRHVVSNSVVVPAHGFTLLGVSLNTSGNGGAPVVYQWNTFQFALGNGADEIVLLDAGSNEVSRIEYSDAAFPWPDPHGASMYLRGPDLDVNDPASWAVSTSRQPGFIGAAGDHGSPRGPNPQGDWRHQTVFTFR